jgi:5'-nucleotidase
VSSSCRGLQKKRDAKSFLDPMNLLGRCWLRNMDRHRCTSKMHACANAIAKHIWLNYIAITAGYQRPANKSLDGIARSLEDRIGGSPMVIPAASTILGTIAPSKKLRVAIDMDETIANSLKEHRLRFRTTFGVDLSEEELRGKNIEDLVPENQRAAVRRLVQDGSFFEDLELIDGAREVVRDLAAEHDVFIVSAAMEVPESFAAKYRWLRRHFPFIPGSNLVFCGDKRIIAADYLIDDHARHFQGFRGTGILFSAPHNAGITGCCRVENWQEIRKMFLNPLKPLDPGAHVCRQVDRNGKGGLLHDSLG